MTSQARLTAARLAVRIAAAGANAGNLQAATARCMGAYDAAILAARLDRRATIVEARIFVRKSAIARLLCGKGDLWNGSDRAHQFALLNEAARVRRAVATSARG